MEEYFEEIARQKWISMKREQLYCGERLQDERKRNLDWQKHIEKEEKIQNKERSACRLTVTSQTAERPWVTSQNDVTTTNS